MKRIFKYQITEENKGRIMMPLDCEFLSAAVQDGKPTIWAIVDDEQEPVRHQFDLYWTGAEMPHSQYEHLFTWQDNKGLVWHLFEVPVID